MPFLQAEMFRFHNEKLEENLEFTVSNRYRKCHFWPQPSEHVAGNTLLICIVCWERKAIKLVSRAPLPRINSGVFVSQVNTKGILFEIYQLIWKNKTGSLEGMVKGILLFSIQGAGKVGYCHLQNAFEHVFQKLHIIHDRSCLIPGD